MLYHLQTFFAYISMAIMFLSLIICFWRMKSIDEELRILSLYFILYLVIGIWSAELSSRQINNLPLLHIYTILEFIIWSWFYKTMLKKEPFFKNGFTLFAAIIVAFLIINSIYLEPVFGFNSNAKALVQIILIGYSFHFFFSTYGKIDFSKRENQSKLLINFAVLLYYSGSLFIFMFMKSLMNMGMVGEGTRGFWFFNSFLLLIFQILILIAVLKAAFPKKSI